MVWNSYLPGKWSVQLVYNSVCARTCVYTHLELGVVNHATIPPSPQTTGQGGDHGDGRFQTIYRDMATRRIFWGFCTNRFGIGPLHYISSRSDFGFEFAEIRGDIRNLKTTLRLAEFSFTFKSRLSDSASRGVVDSSTRRTNFCKNPRKSASLTCPFKYKSAVYRRGRRLLGTVYSNPSHPPSCENCRENNFFYS